MRAIAKGILVEREAGASVEHELKTWKVGRNGAPHHIPTATRLGVMDDYIAFITIYEDRTFDLWNAGKGSLEADQVEAKIEELDHRIRARSRD